VPRKIRNEAEIIDGLVVSGFTILDTASTTLDELLDTLVNAKIVVSLEGSHIAHCVYAMPSDSGLLVLQPPDRFSASQRLWTSCLGIRSGFVVGKVHEAGYEFDPVEIHRTIDLLERAIA
jgi:capsular polysaccharide biosynthesis protein